MGGAVLGEPLLWCENDEFCIKNEKLRVKNEKFCYRNHKKTRIFVLKLMIFVVCISDGASGVVVDGEASFCMKMNDS